MRGAKLESIVAMAEAMILSIDVANGVLSRLRCPLQGILSDAQVQAWVHITSNYGSSKLQRC
jgi:hypothetical protein